MAKEVSPGRYRCPGCKKCLSAEGFYLDKSSANGLRVYCKRCSIWKSTQAAKKRPLTERSIYRASRYFTYYD